MPTGASEFVKANTGQPHGQGRRLPPKWPRFEPGSVPRVRTCGKSERREGRNQPADNNGRRAVKKIQDEKHRNASQRGANEIHAVDLAGREGAARERQTDHDAGKYIGHGHDREQQRP